MIRRFLLWGSITCVGGFIALIALLSYLATPPSDKKLMAQFNAKRVHFEKLQQMLASDSNVNTVASWGVTASTNRWSRADNVITPERRQQYTKVLAEAGTKMAIHDEEEFRFGVVAWGWAGKGWRIAYTYRTNAPTPIIQGLDGFRKTKSGMEDAYRRIDENWYLWIVW
jgi:hypothetical protein